MRTHSGEAMRTCGHLRTLNPYIGMCVFVRPCALAPRVRYNQVTLRLGASKARLAYQVQHGSVDGTAPRHRSSSTVYTTLLWRPLSTRLRRQVLQNYATH